MKKFARIIFLLILTIRCGGNDSFYQKKPPMVFAKNVISTEKYEFGCCLSSNNRIIFFAANGWDSTDMFNQDIYYSELKSGLWQKPRPVPFNTKMNEFDPVLNNENNKLYFCSNRPGGIGNDDIWVISWEKSLWGQPVNLGSTVNTERDEWGPSFSENGKILIFSSDGYKGFGMHDLFISQHENNNWSYPINLGGAVNSTSNDFDPCVIGKLEKLIFASDRAGGLGKVDLWQTRRKKNAWIDPVNLGKLINSPDWDYGPFLTENGRLFFFTTINRSTDNPWGDIWVVRR